MHRLHTVGDRRALATRIIDDRCPGALVTWEQLYNRRIVEGTNPAGENSQPSSSSTTTLWVRDQAQRPIDYPALAALCDIFYPRV
jgi:hypothetical protein